VGFYSEGAHKNFGASDKTPAISVGHGPLYTVCCAQQPLPPVFAFASVPAMTKVSPHYRRRCHLWTRLRPMPTSHEKNLPIPYKPTRLL